MDCKQVSSSRCFTSLFSFLCSSSVSQIPQFQLPWKRTETHVLRTNWRGGKRNCGPLLWTKQWQCESTLRVQEKTKGSTEGVTTSLTLTQRKNVTVTRRGSIPYLCNSCAAVFYFNASSRFIFIAANWNNEVCWWNSKISPECSFRHSATHTRPDPSTFSWSIFNLFRYEGLFFLALWAAFDEVWNITPETQFCQ